MFNNNKKMNIRSSSIDNHIELAHMDLDLSLSDVNSIDPLNPNNNNIIINNKISYYKYLYENINQIINAQKLVFRYVITEAQRHRRSFLTGTFTVFLVVLFVSLLLNSVTKSPIVFFKLAENAVGENDLVLTPGFSVNEEVVMKSDVLGLPLLNHSVVNHSMIGITTSSGTAPRWILIAKVSNADTTNTFATSSSSSLIDATAVILGINTIQEAHIGYGREWKYDTLGANEIVLSRTIVRQIGMDPAISIGATVNIGIQLIDVLTAFGGLNIDRDNTTLLRQEFETLIPGLSEFWDSTITLTIDPFNIPGLNITSFLDNVTNNNNNINGTRVNVSLAIDILDAILVPILNVTLNLDETQVRELIDETNIPGFGNITTILEEIINGLQSNGSLIRLNVTVAPLLDALLPFFINELNINVPMIIRGIVDEPSGKWPASLGSVVVMDTSSLIQTIKDGYNNFRNFEGNLTGLRDQLNILTNFDIVNDIPGLDNSTRNLWARFWNGDDILDPNGTLTNTINSLNEVYILLLR